MISRFRVQNYKALRDATLDLTPVHALIGPNDSGKTSLLEAVAALGRSVDRPLSDIFLTDWTGTELLTIGGGDVVRLSCSVPGRLGLDYMDPEEEPNYHLGLLFCSTGEGRDRVLADEERLSFIPPNGGDEILGQELEEVSANYGSLSGRIWPRYKQGEFGPEWAPTGWVLHEIVRACAPLQYLRWNPKALAMPSAINTARAGRLEVNGFGLPTLLDAIRDRDGGAYAAVQDEFCGFFPGVQAVRLVVQDAFDANIDPPGGVYDFRRAPGKGIMFDLDGGSVPASQASDGLLYVLGYLALLHSPDPPKILLIEEPENGIHPARLGEVIGILRKLVADRPGTQVILTTHSPYAVSHFAPEEVTHCRKIDGEVRVRRMDRYKTVAEQIDLFTLGEIWTAEEDHGLKAEDHAAPALPSDPADEARDVPAGAAG